MMLAMKGFSSLCERRAFSMHIPYACGRTWWSDVLPALLFICKADSRKISCHRNSSAFLEYLIFAPDQMRRKISCEMNM